MDIHLQRSATDEGKTFGELIVDGVFQCYTLEDAIRDVKVPGMTAIPAGRYRVRLTLSNRFKKVLPLLVDVPNFEGIRIHSGNTEHDTEGCILVGRYKAATGVTQSRAAMDTLMGMLRMADAVGEPIWITVANPEASAAA